MYEDIKDLEEIFGSDMSDVSIGWEMTLTLSPNKKDIIEDVISRFTPSYGFDTVTMEDDEEIDIKFSGDIPAEMCITTPTAVEMAAWLDSMRSEMEGRAQDLSDAFYPAITETSVDVYNW